MTSTLDWTDHRALLMSGLKHFFLSGKLSDLEIRCGSRVFNVHKVVLSCFTNYFQNCDGLWTRIDVDPSMMDAVLNFIYRGHVIITYDRIEDFLATCKFLGLYLFKKNNVNHQGLTEEEQVVLCQCQQRYELNELNLLCQKCYKCFDNEKVMKKHNWNCGRQQIMYKCRVCGHTSRFRVEHRNHELTHPSIALPFKCSIFSCSRAFKLKSQVREHMLSKHSALRHKCSDCDQIFKFGFELADHIKRVHQPLTSLECKNCDSSFKSNLLLQVHVKQKHGPGSDQVATTNPAKSGTSTASNL